MSGNFIATPTFSLSIAQGLVAGGAIWVTQSARKDSFSLGLTVQDILDILASLESTNFYKSMESLKVPGQYQDVYRVTFNGLQLYFKFQIEPIIGSKQEVIILSCKLLYV